MQDKLVVTIADEKGLKQFQVHKHIKKIIFWGLIAFCAFIVAIFFTMKFLMHTIDSVALEQNVAISEYRYIYQQNEILKNQIQQKNYELSVIHQKIDDLESIIGTQKNNQRSHDKVKEIDLETLNNEHKEVILNLIPNGFPVKEYSVLENAFSRENSSRRKKEALGVDFIVKNNTPVYATSDGVIDTIRTKYKKGYGNFVVINHSFGFSSLYAHLNTIVLKKGDFVKKGELIGYTGSSGSVKQPLLYYEVLFLNKTLPTQRYIDWNIKNFNDLLLHDSVIDWKNLVWTIQDVVRLKNFQNNFKGRKSEE
ncbi:MULTISPECIES: M23 family metallopeptidase [unclassified Helicobacter]|uniref:M23 family metallopeptidase n=1 Tax=unclassified Helicobacter TaxID=2593540 RepID=UPI0013151700|nr:MULTISPECIES: M23 family metallopeptidase [unclassified Helicobacter]